MGFGCDSEPSILLCPEDNSCILDFGDDEGGVSDVGFDRGVERLDQRLDLWGDSVLGFPARSDECLEALVSKEAYHLPKVDYLERLQTGSLDLSDRCKAVEWMSKVHGHYNFGPLSFYLSVNYLDRFTSLYYLPRKAWMAQLISIACLSLAAKMEETQIPHPLDLQVGKSEFVFETRTIKRMELLVMSTLKWRMQAVTPFSFIDYFLHKFGDDKPLPSSMIIRYTELVLDSSRSIKFLEFRPSEVAAAVALFLSMETSCGDIKETLSSCPHINQEQVLRCYDAVKDMALEKKGLSGSLSSVPHSPVGVLDAVCLSFTSDDTAVGSVSDTNLASPEAKRRKTGGSS